MNTEIEALPQLFSNGPIAGLTSFKLSDSEWMELDRRFGDLCKFASWQLLRKNIKNSHTDDLEDIEQELKKAVVIAAMYFKRQVYIESCLEAVKSRARDSFIKQIVNELESLWKNRTKHGANRQKFGPYQEKLLKALVENYVPSSLRPDVATPIKIDKKFATYCKAITWNSQKTMGRKITKERSIRGGIVSLSQHDHLCGTDTF